MKDLFDFNHIDPSINEETKEELKEMYKYITSRCIQFKSFNGKVECACT